MTIISAHQHHISFSGTHTLADVSRQLTEPNEHEHNTKSRGEKNERNEEAGRKMHSQIK